MWMEAGTLKSISLVQRQVDARASDWPFAFTSSVAKHVRYHVGPAVTGGGDDYADVTLWSRLLVDTDKAILVLSGTDNGTM